MHTTSVILFLMSILIFAQGASHPHEVTTSWFPFSFLNEARTNYISEGNISRYFMYVDSFWLAASLRRPSVTKIHLAGNFTKETRKIVGTYGLASFTAVADGCLLVMTYIPSFQIVARLLTDVKKIYVSAPTDIDKAFSLVFGRWNDICISVDIFGPV